MNIAYIDAQNTYRGIRNAGRKIDRKKFFEYLTTRYDIQKIKLFIGYVPQHKQLYDELQSIGYEVVFRQVVRQQGEIKGNIDSNLVFQVMLDYFMGNLDLFFLVSGDGDFDVVVNFLREQGKLGKILLPHAPHASTLLKTSINNGFIQDLGSIRHIIGKKS